MAPLANDKRLAKRRAAKELLVGAFLAAAFDIAAGDWQNKDVTTEKWLASARELSEAMITHDQGDELCRLKVTLATLSAHAEMTSTQSPDSLIASVSREVQRLNDASGDPLFSRELDLLRGQGAVRRGQHRSPSRTYRSSPRTRHARRQGRRTAG